MTATTLPFKGAGADATLEKRPSGRGILIVFLIAAMVLIVHAWSFLPFISDDALISLRYSRRLLDGHGLTWTDGPRVEGYTNLLWVLACAALGGLHIDLIVASRILGFAGMIASLAGIAYSQRRRCGTIGPFLGCVGLAMTAPIAVWTIGGMEQPFVAAPLGWAIAFCLNALSAEAAKRSLPAASLCLGLLCLTRADGGVLCIAIALGLLLAGGFGVRSWRQVLTLAIFPVLLGGGQLIFRRVYYNEWLPNPARVKVAFTADRIASGLAYLRDASPYVGLFLLLAVSGAIMGLRRPDSRARTWVLIIVLLFTIGYTALIGGDVFPTHRHFVPILVIAAFLAAQIELPINAMSLIASCLLLAGLGAVQRFDPEVRRAIEEHWEWDGQRVGELLRTAFGKSDPLIACDPAGCIPYFTGFRSIDMMGLNDYHIAHNRPADFGRGRLGHELGDGKYVLDQK
ncbi:MAG TPA: hypothetical protein VMV81_10255, partial [Phycisphaerae bacterium]|nr:hypothetical protein [Phycisphaerae bacterium]